MIVLLLVVLLIMPLHWVLAVILASVSGAIVGAAILAVRVIKLPFYLGYWVWDRYHPPPPMPTDEELRLAAGGRPRPQRK
jgi:hypothetical protein